MFMFNNFSYCNGTLWVSDKNQSEQYILFCASAKIYKKLENPPREYTLIEILTFVMETFNIVSCLLLIITALLYYFIPEVQDIEGICTFHLTLNMGIFHGSVAYMFMFPIGLLPDFCITAGKCFH